MVTKAFITRVYEKSDNGFSTSAKESLFINLSASEISYPENELKFLTPFKASLKKGLLLEFNGVTYKITSVSKEQRIHYFFNVIKCEKI